MRPLSLVLFTLAFLTAAAFTPSPTHADPTLKHNTLPTLLPPNGALPGCKKSAPPEFYTPENLWDCIDGAAVLYLDYGFQALVTQSYSTADSKAGAQVEIYQMESPLHAFAIYAAERSPQDEPVRIGAGGYRTANVLNFWKGPYYTKVSSYKTGEASESLLRNLAGIVAGRIPGEYAEPAAFRLFPTQGRVPRSERYIPKNFMGHTFFNGGYRVDYQGENTKYQLFLVPNASTEEAKQAFADYRKYLEAQQPPVTLDKEAPYPLIRAADRQTVFQYGTYVGGVLNEPDASHARRLIEEMVTRIRAANAQTK